MKKGLDYLFNLKLCLYRVYFQNSINSFNILRATFN